MALDEIMDNWSCRGVDPRYFIGRLDFSLRPEDYSITAIRAGNPDFKLPTPIHFIPELTPYGVIIRAPRKNKVLNAAVLGFEAHDGVIDCLQVQGAPGRYRELTPIRWDNALLGSAVELAKKSGLDAVMVLPSFLVEGVYGKRKNERVYLRHDQNAIAHGFVYSPSQKRYVLELKG